MEEQRGENPFDEPVRKLKATDPEGLAARAGASWEPSGGGGRLSLPVLAGSVSVIWPEIKVEGSAGLDSFSIKLLTLLYLVHTDGTPPSGQWVAYRELPGGLFYEPVVKRSVEDPLALAFGSDTARFGQACEMLCGTPMSLGDSSGGFSLFPNVMLAFILWRADEEFEARAQVLFDSFGTRHLNAFDLRMGAQEISARLIKAGGLRP